MRTIKFRAWDKIGKRMLFVHDLRFASTSEVMDVCASDTGKDKDKLSYSCYGAELMQFTGLLDKNGKEIYEGDIIEYMDFATGTEGDGDEFINQGVVEWDEETLRFVVGNKHEVDDEDIFLDKERIRVIGNIYQNPELIK